MISRTLGSILLIIGTCIGGSILALPLITAELSGNLILVILVAVWSVMTLSAVLILDLTLALPGKTNLISMAKATSGPFVIFLTWCVYLLLLYALLSAYLAGGTDLTRGLFKLMSIDMPNYLATCLFLFVFIVILYQGIACVDWTNRGLMIIKLSSFFLLMFFLIPYNHYDTINWAQSKASPLPAIMPIVNSFGFAIIVPSLVVYLQKNFRAVRFAVIIGSLFPLLAYVLWVFSVQSSINTNTLAAIAVSSKPISGLAEVISSITHSRHIEFFSYLFTSICITTSFLGVSLSVTDFLKDGLAITAGETKNTALILTIAFLPPLLIVLLYPAIFIELLKYAGFFCVILLIMLPTYLFWRACYHKKIIPQSAFYHHRIVLSLNMVVGILLLVCATQL